MQLFKDTKSWRMKLSTPTKSSCSPQNTSFIFLQRHRKRHKHTIFHVAALQVLLEVPPTSKQINYLSRHSPRQLESFEEDISNGTTNLTIKKKVVHKHMLPKFLCLWASKYAVMTSMVVFLTSLWSNAEEIAFVGKHEHQSHDTTTVMIQNPNSICIHEWHVNTKPRLILTQTKVKPVHSTS